MVRLKSIFLSLMLLFFIFQPLLAKTSKTDLNKEFVENFFKLKSGSSDISLRVYSDKKGVKVDSLDKQTSKASTDKIGYDDADPEIATPPFGRFVQLLIIFLLGAMIYLVSRKSKKNKRL